MRFLSFILTRAKNVLPNEKLASARQLILNKCDFVVDIGANNGQWISEVISRGYKGNALCIEPLKKNYEILNSRNINSISTLNCAVGNKNGYSLYIRLQMMDCHLQYLNWAAIIKMQPRTLSLSVKKK